MKDHLKELQRLSQEMDLYNTEPVPDEEFTEWELIEDWEDSIWEEEDDEIEF